MGEQYHNLRVRWKHHQHEKGVESFYATGISDIHEYHGGYLNFGWWETTDDYMEAAETLVYKIGLIGALKEHSRVLDLACGMAPQNVYLHRMFGSDFDCVDVTWPHVKIARKRVEQAGMQKHIRIHHGSATDLKFNNNTFDTVMSIEGPEHFKTREKFFHEAYRVLKKGGKLALSDYTLKRPPKNKIEKIILKITQKLWHVPRENVYTTKTYEKKLKQTGFKNISVIECGKYVIPGYVKEQYRKETRKELTKIRGWFAAYPGLIIDYFMLKVYKIGLVEYVLVRAEK